MFFFQTFEGQIAIILREFNYSNVLNRPEQKKKVVYNQFLTRLEGVVRREVKSLTIFIDFLQRNREAFRNVDVLVLIRDFFFHVYSAYQTHRTTDDRKRASLNTIENNWGPNARAAYADKSHDYLNYVARVIKIRVQPMTLNQMQKIIDHRLANPGLGVPTSKKAKNRNWKILANQIFEKTITGNRRIQNVISLYAAFLQVPFSSERRDPSESSLTRRLLRLRSLRRPPPSVTPSLLSSPPPHSSLGSPAPRSQKSISQERMKAAPRDGAEPLTSTGEMMNIEKEEEEIRVKKKKRRAPKKGKSRTKKAKKEKKENRTMRTRLLRGCPCPKYSDGPGKDWKKNFDVAYGNGEMHQAMLCFSEMMYAGWEVVACGEHCAMMEEALSMIFCEHAGDSRKNLTKLWAARYDFEDYKQRNPNFFKNTQ